MSKTKVRVSLLAALVVAGIALPVWQQTRLQRAQSANARARAQETELAALRGGTGGLRPVETGQDELERLRQWKAQAQPELLRLRGKAALQRRADAEAEELRAQVARQTSGTGAMRASGPMGELMMQAMRAQCAAGGQHRTGLDGVHSRFDTRARGWGFCRSV